MWTVQLSGVIGALPLVAAVAALLRRLRLAAAAHGLSCLSGHATVILTITALVAPYFKGW
jgi:hypothetical protein